MIKNYDPFYLIINFFVISKFTLYLIIQNKINQHQNLDFLSLFHIFLSHNYDLVCHNLDFLAGLIF